MLICTSGDLLMERFCKEMDSELVRLSVMHAMEPFDDFTIPEVIYVGF